MWIRGKPEVTWQLRRGLQLRTGERLRAMNISKKRSLRRPCSNMKWLAACFTSGMLIVIAVFWFQSSNCSLLQAIAYMGDDFMFQLFGKYRDMALAVKNPCHLNMAACLIKLNRFDEAIVQCSIVCILLCSWVHSVVNAWFTFMSVFL